MLGDSKEQYKMRIQKLSKFNRIKSKSVLEDNRVGTEPTVQFVYFCFTFSAAASANIKYGTLHSNWQTF